MFTREDTSLLPVPETLLNLVKKFNGSEEEKLGQLNVTPEVIASKINNMKENKSPGVDGLSPKILKETVEQISKPLAHVFTLECLINVPVRVFISKNMPHYTGFNWPYTILNLCACTGQSISEKGKLIMV